MAEPADHVFDCRVSQFYESLPMRDQIVEADGADEFFDVPSTPPKAEGAVTEEFFTPLQIPNGQKGALNLLSPVAEEPEQEGSNSCDRRKSVSDLPQGRIILKAKRRSWQLPKKIDDGVKGEIDRLANQVFEGIRLEPPTPEKKHAMVTRQDVLVRTPTLSLRNRQVVRLHMKRSRIQSPSVKGPPAKYMGIAEQVYHFFKDTPPRFKRSSIRPIGPENQVNEGTSRLRVTIPHSPSLLTKERTRSPSPKPEEMPKIKPLPLNPKVFQPPDLSSKPPSKPTTVPKPFNLTESLKKVIELSTDSSELIQFKARPVPKSCRSSLSSLSSISSAATSERVRRVAVGSAVYEKGKNLDVEVKEVNNHFGVNNTWNNRNCKVQPFSFDMRDHIARQKKEQKIKQLKEEASKVPKFTARPVPSFISHGHDDDNVSVSTQRSSHHHHHHPDNTFAVPHFKAKPATVLTKEPFVPVPKKAPLTEIHSFEMNTERRARERARYDQARLEKEKAAQKELEKVLIEESQKEKNMIKQLRKSMMPKPTPKPSYLSNNAK